jgi:hypothetical protein
MKIRTLADINRAHRRAFRQKSEGTPGKTRDGLVRSFLARHVGGVFALKTNWYGFNRLATTKHGRGI